MITLEKRFWEKVKVAGADECWEWTGVKAGSYGQIKINRHGHAAHRVSWQFVNGVIPSGAQVLHKCDNRICVNTAHLFLGDHAANMRDEALKNRGGNAKLSLDDVRWVREWGAFGWPHRLLASAVGCAECNISNILSGKSRKHI